MEGGALVDTRLLTNVPIELAIEKLRGFISDRDARILKVTSDEVSLEVNDTAGGRGGPQMVTFVIEIQFGQQREAKTNTAGLAAGEYVYTVANVRIRPKRERDRRQTRVSERARLLLGNLKSYLMANEKLPEPQAATAE